MKLFKRKNKIAAEKSASKLHGYIIKIQSAFARMMDKKVNHLSVNKRKRLLYVFIISLSAYFIFLVVSPFILKRKSYSVQVDAITFPKKSNETGEPLHNEAFVSPEEYNHIHSFKLYLDSLSKDENGKSIYDSIIATHPKLMDSIQMIEEYYQLQK